MTFPYILSVCGAGNVQEQKGISANLAKMQKIYEFAVANPVVQKVKIRIYVFLLIKGEKSQ